MRRGLAIMTVAAIVAASCGDDGGSADEAPPTTAAVEETTSTTSTTSSTTTSSTTTTAAPATTVEEQPEYRSGAEVLADDGFELLQGRRVGLIANHTALVGDERLIDRLAAEPGVDLVAIFAPEHGVEGVRDAGEIIEDGSDANADVPIYSLYGSAAARKPTPEMLAGLDVLVFDLQDVGTRFYTYISTMGLAMQAAAEAGIPFVVLDRANPQGGIEVDGFVREPEQESFVSQYPIPSLYGMTVGELAHAVRGEEWLAGVGEVDLTVVEVHGWSRDEMWDDIGDEWVPPSPGLPDLPSTYAYPGTVLVEATTLSYGRGTWEPFAVVGASWADDDALVEELNGRGLAGVEFQVVDFVPIVLPIAPTPRHEGVTQYGVRILVTDPDAFEPVKAGVHVLTAFQDQATALGLGSIVDRADMFDLLAGSPSLRTLLEAGTDADSIIEVWESRLAGFLTLREQYLLYD